jgi:hypothetical protein
MVGVVSRVLPPGDCHCQRSRCTCTRPLVRVGRELDCSTRSDSPSGRGSFSSTRRQRRPSIHRKSPRRRRGPSAPSSACLSPRTSAPGTFSTPSRCRTRRRSSVPGPDGAKRRHQCGHAGAAHAGRRHVSAPCRRDGHEPWKKIPAAASPGSCRRRHLELVRTSFRLASASRSERRSSFRWSCALIERGTGSRSVAARSARLAAPEPDHISSNSRRIREKRPRK